jgi:hypothetical protein
MMINARRRIRDPSVLHILTGVASVVAGAKDLRDAERSRVVGVKYALVRRGEDNESYSSS